MRHVILTQSSIKRNIMGSSVEFSEIVSLVKGELHVHLNGLVSSSLVREIIDDEEANIPDEFDLYNDLVRRSPCPSLSNYLKPWQALRRIPSKPTNLKRMCDNAFGSLSSNNVKFVELRSSLIYLASLQNCKVSEALNRLIEATSASAAKYNIFSGIILTVTRGDYSTVHLDALLTAFRDLGCPRDVVGLDLAGDEEIPIPQDLPAQFKAAKEKYGLGISIHAGETGRPDNIVTAVTDFGADRIGHGTAASFNPYVMDLLCEHDVCVEVCPISNRLTGAVKLSDAHPLREFHRRGVPFVICSDNPGIHELGLNDDYMAALREGINLDFLRGQYTLAIKHSFLGV
jgi:adenosine deaminase